MWTFEVLKNLGFKTRFYSPGSQELGTYTSNVGRREANSWRSKKTFCISDTLHPFIIIILLQNLYSAQNYFEILANEIANLDQ